MSFSNLEQTKLLMWGRRFAPREGRDEFSNPTYWSDSDGQNEPVRPKPEPGSTHTVAKLIIMSVVMIALLLAAIAIFA
jgi:hypothetical protein